MNSNASSKYCLRLACPLSRADRRLYCTPGARWSTDGDGDCWLVVTFNTRVTPMAVIPSRSSASLLLPRYKKGRTLVSGWESIMSRATSDGQLNGAGNNEFSHMSLWRKWNSLWPPGEKQFNRQRSVKHQTNKIILCFQDYYIEHNSLHMVLMICMFLIWSLLSSLSHW